MTHKFTNQATKDCCKPDCPPPSTDQEPCTGTLNGAITGTVTMECCCPRQYTRTFIVNIGPQSEGALITYLQNTVNAYENAGYQIVAHSLVDVGAGWLLGLTVGYYA